MVYNFVKMDGLGNDLVIIDARSQALHFKAKQIQAIAHRHHGIGFDQVILLETPRHDPRSDVFMRIFNSDGSEAEACGNAARCVAWLLAEEFQRLDLFIETAAGLQQAQCLPGYNVRVHMGQANFDWQTIPLSHSMDPLHLDIRLGTLSDPIALSMGNPHLVFFVEDGESIDMATSGPQLEHHPYFPKAVNVNIAQVINASTVMLRVWERGAGLTQACGTGACATVAAAVKRNLTSSRCEVIQKGGTLFIEVTSDDYVNMTGKVSENFRGTFNQLLFTHER